MPENITLRVVPIPYVLLTYLRLRTSANSKNNPNFQNRQVLSSFEGYDRAILCDYFCSTHSKTCFMAFQN